MLCGPGEVVGCGCIPLGQRREKVSWATTTPSSPQRVLRQVVVRSSPAELALSSTCTVLCYQTTVQALLKAQLQAHSLQAYQLRSIPSSLHNNLVIPSSQNPTISAYHCLRVPPHKLSRQQGDTHLTSTKVSQAHSKAHRHPSIASIEADD